MGRAVAVVGMPGCGKGVLSELVAEAGLPVYSMGDMIRREVESRGLAGDPHVFGEVAQQMRDEHGYGVLATRLAPLIDEVLSNYSLVLIEGMRGIAERDVFADCWGDDFMVVAIVADSKTRLQRISLRGRAEDGDKEAFEMRDERESGWGVEMLMQQANWTLDNSSDIGTFKNLSTRWLNSLI